MATSYKATEGNISGVVEYGYCDGHFIQSKAETTGRLKLSYDYIKHDYNETYYNEFKGNLTDTLVMTRLMDGEENDIKYSILNVDYVIEKDNIVNVVTHVENNILPIIGSTIKEDNIYINLLIKNKKMEELETIKSYIVFTDSSWNERTDNLVLAGKLVGEGYKDGVKGNDTNTKLKASITSFKNFYVG